METTPKCAAVLGCTPGSVLRRRNAVMDGSDLRIVSPSLIKWKPVFIEEFDLGIGDGRRVATTCGTLLVT